MGEEKDPKEAMVSMKMLEATLVARVGKDPRVDTMAKLNILKTRLLATMVAREEKDPKEAMVSMKKLDSMAERVEKDPRVDTMEMMMMIVIMAPREEKDPKEAMVSMKKLEATSVA